MAENHNDRPRGAAWYLTTPGVVGQLLFQQLQALARKWRVDVYRHTSVFHGHSRAVASTIMRLQAMTHEASGGLTCELEGRHSRQPSRGCTWDAPDG